MIGRLAVAQLRAHRVQSAWTLGLLALLAAIVTAMFAIGATEARLQQQARTLVGEDREHLGYADLLTGLEGPSSGTGVEPIDTSALDAALAATPGALAVSAGDLSLRPIEDADALTTGDLVFVAAFSDADAAGKLIVEGRAPSHVGEIAITPELARRLDADLGSEVTLFRPPFSASTWNSRNFAVVGIISSATLANYQLSLPDALLAWDQASTPQGPQGLPGPTDGLLTSVYVNWDGYSPRLDGLVGTVVRFEAGRTEILSPATYSGPLKWSLALIAAMLITSFAVGRSQAASRTQWVGTVRALGASARYVAFATIVETILLAAIAAAAGLALGLAAAQGYLTWSRSRVGSPLGSAWITVGTLTVPIVVGVVLAVALIIAAVPAFWAARVPPVAALKPVNDVTEAQISRDVRTIWLWPPLAASIVAMGTQVAYPNGGMEGLYYLGLVGTVVTGGALWLEGIRRGIRAAGRRLASSRNLATMLAGDSLRLRPRQAVAPAAIVGVACICASPALTQATNDLANAVPTGYRYASWTAQGAWRSLWDALSSPTWVGTFTGVMLVILLVTTTIGVSHRAATAREAGATRALGAPRRDVVRAHVRQVVTAQAIGIAAGIGAFTVAMLAIWAVSTAQRTGLTGATTAYITHTAFDSIQVVLMNMLLAGSLAAALGSVFLAVSALVARLVANLTTPARPAGSLASES